jgi:hypothetical protein
VSHHPHATLQSNFVRNHPRRVQIGQKYVAFASDCVKGEERLLQAGGGSYLKCKCNHNHVAPKWKRSHDHAARFPMRRGAS